MKSVFWTIMAMFAMFGTMACGLEFEDPPGFEGGVYTVYATNIEDSCFGTAQGEVRKVEWEFKDVSTEDKESYSILKHGETIASSPDGKYFVGQEIDGWYTIVWEIWIRWNNWGFGGDIVDKIYLQGAPYCGDKWRIEWELSDG